MAGRAQRRGNERVVRVVAVAIRTRKVPAVHAGGPVSIR